MDNATIFQIQSTYNKTLTQEHNPDNYRDCVLVFKIKQPYYQSTSPPHKTQQQKP